ncbi:MAG: alanine racemase, partial [Kiritimatiellae bacterium]|nr:alanine racemase [Kiritimatiellia bacterium]
WVHAANSDAICHLPEAARPPFNLVRAGLAMHGLADMGESRPEWLREVASFRARIVSARTLPAGSSVGYGATFRLDRPMRVGTIAAGYADGIPLALSNACDVIVGGARCPIVGRISMDYTTIDLTNAPGAAPGDVATLFGADGAEAVSPADWARVKRTHPYDIICSVSPRVPRITV